MPPIHVSSTFVQPGAGVWGQFDYTRSGNPTRKGLETTLANLENGCGGLAFSSGMAATHCVTMLLFRPAITFWRAPISNGGTYRLLHKIVNRAGITVSLVNTTDLKAVEAAITPKTKLFVDRKPRNPLLSITDIAACAQIAKKRQLLLGVDSTLRHAGIN